MMSHASLEAFAKQFWHWRAKEQPIGPDDIPRIVRATDWTPKWALREIKQYRADVISFQRTLSRGSKQSDSRSERVDWALMGSAVARARWELDDLKSWQRDPNFYVDQTLGSYVEALLEPPPFGELRARQIICRLDAIPATLEAARKNLAGEAVPAFRDVAIANLAAIEEQVLESINGLAKHIPGSHREVLMSSGNVAARALSAYAGWLEIMPCNELAEPGIGPVGFDKFLKTVALIGLSVEDLISIATVGYRDATTGAAIEEACGCPSTTSPEFDLAVCVKIEADSETAMRAFYRTNGLLSLPEDMGHYRFAATPDYLVPVKWWGVTDYLGGANRLRDDGVRYMNEGDAPDGFFMRAFRRHPSLAIAHEGAHYYQLGMAWRHHDFIRRHYYDSGPNEGIAYYNELLLRRAGAFNAEVGARSALWQFAKLRAVRVHVDLGLALGRLDLKSAALYLQSQASLDDETARAEACFFAANPGQGLSYEIGRYQIGGLIAQTFQETASAQELGRLHDYIWTNGNVPFALMAFELFGKTDELKSVSALGFSES